MAIEHDTPVLVVGAGPAGLLAALQLARHGTRCMLVERNSDTTKWPKMDLTNCRSMELFRRMKIADGLREQGVPPNYSFDVLFSTGLSDGGELITKWDLASVDRWRERIAQQNDGSMPREPYQRVSQKVFEAWLKPQLQAEPLVECYFGTKFESLSETADGVESEVIEVESGKKHIIRSGPTPMALYLVHFKSRDLTRLHRQGQFWHIFFSNGAALISQDEVDTWTAHLAVGLDVDIASLDAEKSVYQVLGGSAGPYPVEIDEILVTSSWRPNICVADKYTSRGRRVFLSGDSAHQNIPTGGYGMNTAIADSFDIGWKLSAVLKGYGGQYLLESYEPERRPVAVRNIDHSGKHMSLHIDWWGWCAEAGPEVTTAQNEEGRKLRKKITDFAQGCDGENKDQGVEMGYRYNSSPVVVPDLESKEPEWHTKSYVPSTWPGARPPHVFLTDGKTSIFDLFGPDFTIVDFSQDAKHAGMFESVAKKLDIPIKAMHLPHESHARSIWARDAVLIRPDDHVAWRAPSGDDASVDVEDVLLIAVGKRRAPEHTGNLNGADQLSAAAEKEGFTSTIGHVDQDKVEMLAEFQK